MATSANPIFQNYSAKTQVTLHATVKVAQATSMLVPPLYIITTLARRRPLSINAIMRNAATSVVIGAGIGTGVGYFRLKNEPQDKIDDRMERLRYNVGQVGTDDYSFIGAAVGALLSPAIFLRRAPMPTLVLGGAAIGIGAGVWTHIVQTLMKGEDVSPDAMAFELPESK